MILAIFLLSFAGLLMLQQRHYLNMVFGLVLLSNAVNLSVFFGSEPHLGLFAFISEGAATDISNAPLAQALVLTAIVIGFALMAFIVAVAKTCGRLTAAEMKCEESSE